MFGQSESGDANTSKMSISVLYTWSEYSGFEIIQNDGQQPLPNGTLARISR